MRPASVQVGRYELVGTAVGEVLGVLAGADAGVGAFLRGGPRQRPEALVGALEGTGFVLGNQAEMVGGAVFEAEDRDLDFLGDGARGKHPLGGLQAGVGGAGTLLAVLEAVRSTKAGGIEGGVEPSFGVENPAGGFLGVERGAEDARLARSATERVLGDEPEAIAATRRQAAQTGADLDGLIAGADLRGVSTQGTEVAEAKPSRSNWAWVV
jgi:hypothetical protein